MIIYRSDKAGFARDVDAGQIDAILLQNLRARRGYGVGPSEVRSWHQSLSHMRLVLADPGIPDDSGVSVELQIPQTTKRIDFLLSGRGEERSDHAVIVELKQWETADPTGMDGVVRTFVGGAVRETAHPSYQAWSYAELLKDFNQAVYEGHIELHPCAFLHNFTDRSRLEDPASGDWASHAPVFVKGEVERLRAFIKRWIRHGDRGDIVVRIDTGEIRPSKSLADSLAKLMEGNREFTMIDEQKVVFERALQLVRETPKGEKRVLIVHGGPGTGKSVVAVNLLVELIQDRVLTQYVTKNAAPRAVYETRLTGQMTKSRFSNLFVGSGQFRAADSGTFPVLIVDEAHRLNEKSGLYKNLGENQVMELIEAADVTVFFLDEDQRVTIQDIGTREEIVHWADRLGAEVDELYLESQFRCNGSDGYLAWLDHVLQIRETANTDLSSLDYDYEFRVVDSPTEMREMIERLDEGAERARMVAGYCWPWTSKKDPEAYDVVIPEHDFRMRWNLASDGSLWLVKPDSVSEIGCIHTCQGLEMEHIGVIVGPDLVVRDGEVIARPEERYSYDSSIRGWKKMLREDPERARKIGRRIVLNTYRTLMTRGMKSCFVFCTDPETQAYFRDAVSAAYAHE